MVYAKSSDNLYVPCIMELFTRSVTCGVIGGRWGGSWDMFSGKEVRQISRPGSDKTVQRRMSDHNAAIFHGRFQVEMRQALFLRKHKVRALCINYMFLRARMCIKISVLVL